MRGINLADASKAGVCEETATHCELHNTGASGDWHQGEPSSGVLFICRV